MSVLFCTRADLIMALSQDSQAKLTNDPLRRWPLGNADGIEDTFTLPFIETTTASVYKNGVLVATTDWSLSSGTGTGGADQIVFTAPPASGAISASADNRAVNLTVVDTAILNVSNMIARYLPTGTDVTNAWLLATLKPIAIHLCKVEFRGRRELGISDSLDMVVKADLEWLRSVRDGKAILPVCPSSTSVSEVVIVEAEDSVFGPFGTNGTDADDELTPV